MTPSWPTGAVTTKNAARAHRDARAPARGSEPRPSRPIAPPPSVAVAALPLAWRSHHGEGRGAHGTGRTNGGPRGSRRAGTLRHLDNHVRCPHPRAVRGGSRRGRGSRTEPKSPVTRRRRRNSTSTVTALRSVTPEKMNLLRGIGRVRLDSNHRRAKYDREGDLFGDLLNTDEKRRDGFLALVDQRRSAWA